MFENRWLIYNVLMACGKKLFIVIYALGFEQWWLAKSLLLKISLKYKFLSDVKIQLWYETLDKNREKLVWKFEVKKSIIYGVNGGFCFKSDSVYVQLFHKNLQFYAFICFWENPHQQVVSLDILNSWIIGFITK